MEKQEIMQMMKAMLAEMKADSKADREEMIETMNASHMEVLASVEKMMNVNQAETDVKL
jgi:hypothetical protein